MLSPNVGADSLCMFAILTWQVALGRQCIGGWTACYINKNVWSFQRVPRPWHWGCLPFPENFETPRWVVCGVQNMSSLSREFGEPDSLCLLTGEGGLANLLSRIALHDHKQSLFFWPHHPNYKVFSSNPH